eukprot:IDg7444t1
MRRNTFPSLVHLLTPLLRCDAAMAARSSRGAISVDVQLGIFIRTMAGAQYLDFIMLFGVSEAAVYKSIREVSAALKTLLPLLGLSTTQTDRIDAAAGFATSRCVTNLLKSCIGAVDSIAIN